MPSERLIQQAQAYLRGRMENEKSMRDDVVRLLLQYGSMLIPLLIQYLRTHRTFRRQDFDNWMEELRSRLLEDCLLLAVDEHTHGDEVRAWVGRTWKGNDLEGRIMERVETFFDEVTALTAAGLLTGKNEQEMTRTLGTWLTTPYDNPVITEARKKTDEGDAVMLAALLAMGLKKDTLDMPHFGRGVATASVTAIQHITTFAVAEGWNYDDYLEHKDTAKGYRVYRGSSYPCDLCDSYVGWHPADDVESLPLYHGHCYCYVVWDDDPDADIIRD